MGRSGIALLTSILPLQYTTCTIPSLKSVLANLQKFNLNAALKFMFLIATFSPLAVFPVTPLPPEESHRPRSSSPSHTGSDWGRHFSVLSFPGMFCPWELNYKKYRVKLCSHQCCEVILAAVTQLHLHPDDPLLQNQPAQHPSICSLRPASHVLIQKKNIQEEHIHKYVRLGSAPTGISSPLIFLSTFSLPKTLTESRVLHQNPHPVLSLYQEPDVGKCGSPKEPRDSNFPSRTPCSVI